MHKYGKCRWDYMVLIKAMEILQQKQQKLDVLLF